MVLGVALVLGALAFGVYYASKPRLPEAYAELVALPSDQLQQMDIARMNLLCAEGLPGAEGLGVDQALGMLDQWAELVRKNEAKHLPEFYRNSRQYDGSVAKFKAVNLGLTLKQDLKCGYNQRLVTQGLMNDVSSTRFFKDAGDLFLHGFTEDRKGSCSSLPVLMVAVGRRCGYPLHLVACKGHLFCRWDDGRERFNIETACPGIDSKPDSHYKHWPHPSTDEEIKSEKYLKNLAPQEELGVFCQIRAACLQENNRTDEAAQAYRHALKSFPDSKQLKLYLDYVERKDGQK